MKKTYVKMNDSDSILSLGNLFRIIKELSQNKMSALQTELFCILFDIDEIHDTTVNNYAIGCRGIGSEYKQKYINYKRKFEKNNDCFYEMVISLISILDGVVYTNITDSKKFINNNKKFRELVNRLFFISKNDTNVERKLISNLIIWIGENEYYLSFVSMLFYIVLENKQPLYQEDLKKQVIDLVLQDTYMSSLELEEYLTLKLRESINFEFSLERMAKKGNAYAAYEMASLEYNGYFKGVPRYDYAYNYLTIAASKKHAGALYMIGNMYYKGYIGYKSNEDLKKGFEYLEKAKELGNIAACNVLGLYYLNGVVPVKKNISKAIEFFLEAAAGEYVYSYNNLGMYYEKNKEYEKALDYYLKSASLGESWACNKVGEIYRRGEWVEKNINKALYYYNQAILSNHRLVCYYAYYNLGNIYYLGNIECGIKKNHNKAIEYLNIASNHNIIEASIMLLKIYIDLYNSRKEEKYIDLIMMYKEKIEMNERYNNDIGKQIEEDIKKIKKYKRINIDFIL